MSVWSGIGAIPAAFYDETISVESTTGRTWGTLISSLACTFEPLSGGNAALMMAMHNGATHVAHLFTYQPTLARGMRVKKGSTYYMVNDVEHHDGTITDLILQSTAATG